eukprot:TRINITY_DN975_c0_g1_i1.p1 TRINITY_DN975_c0_g1~~TRINITY_DN975_c0_g1_i1.p1  ORF type:complete len:458 (-),score=104.35 TRINITY_DN975_c0_g1_i1:18-1391(-)
MVDKFVRTSYLLLGVSYIKGYNVGYVYHTKETNKRPTDREFQEFLSKYESRSSFKGIDFLLSNEWPQGLLEGLSQEQVPQTGLSMLEFDSFGYDVVAHVVSSLTPRYHFASSNKSIFYKRPPYENGKQFEEERKFPCTRFISLAPAFHNKAQFLFGICTLPLERMESGELYEKPVDVTNFPFKKLVIQCSGSKKQKLDEENRKISRYASAVLDTKPGYAQSRRPKKQMTSVKKDQECWFCLSSSGIESHLIVSIGCHFYMTIAKGALHPFHFILVPIKHVASSLQLSSIALVELWKWKEALMRFFEKKKLYMIFYEHNQTPRNAKMQHLHFQVIGGMVGHDSRDVYKEFISEGKNLGLNWQELEITKNNLQSQLSRVASQSQYFWLSISDSENPNRHVAAVLEGEKFPFSFGRRVIARMLGQPGLEDWRGCVLRLEEEKEQAKNFQEELKLYMAEIK